MKEKAQELIDMFYDVDFVDMGHNDWGKIRKECALVCAKRERYILLNLASRVIFGSAAAKVIEYQIEQNQLLIKEIKKL